MNWATFLANPGLGQRLLSAGSAECYFPPVLLTRSRSFSPYVFGIRSAFALRIAALVYMAIPASQNLALAALWRPLCIFSIFFVGFGQIVCSTLPVVSLD